MRIAKVLILTLLAAAHIQVSGQQVDQIETVLKDGVTTVRLKPVQVSGEKDNYYSFHISPSFTYPGEQPRAPEFINFELQTVVKARKLNPDLYVVFVIDGETVFLSSNRWAVKKPVPGRPWVGERMAMRMPVGTFLRLTRAKSAAVKMGATVFEIGDEQKRALAELAKHM